MSEVNKRDRIGERTLKKVSIAGGEKLDFKEKLYATLHDPYISALSEVEDEDIFGGLDDEDLNEYDSLFDEVSRNR